MKDTCQIKHLTLENKPRQNIIISQSTKPFSNKTHRPDLPTPTPSTAKTSASFSNTVSATLSYFFPSLGTRQILFFLLFISLLLSSYSHTQCAFNSMKPRWWRPNSSVWSHWWQKGHISLFLIISLWVWFDFGFSFGVGLCGKWEFYLYDL